MKLQLTPIKAPTRHSVIAFFQQDDLGKVSAVEALSTLARCV
jgi:hypothetical protein